MPITKRDFAEKFTAFFTQIRYRDEVVEWLEKECGYANTTTRQKIATLVNTNKLRRVRSGMYQCR